ncbi:hypothetical protein, partial [Bradyrhizobium cenepequi]|uniref:hypothetical protein n=1 Tax=Bradyrhizobium cenepequi TaxID=2821403 RepID=UPI001CE38AF5
AAAGLEVSADAAGGIPRYGIRRRGGNNDRLSTLWQEVISLAGIARSFSSSGGLSCLTRTGTTVKIQVRSLAIAFAIAVSITVAATAKSPVAPINTSRDDGRALSGAAGLSHL